MTGPRVLFGPALELPTARHWTWLLCTPVGRTLPWLPSIHTCNKQVITYTHFFFTTVFEVILEHGIAVSVTVSIKYFI